MTSLFYRRRKNRLLKSIFPFLLHCERLEQVRDIETLGAFAIDTVGLVPHPWMKIEDFKKHSKYLGAKEAPGGWLYRFELKGHFYQVYRGKGRNRCILISPREFSSYRRFVNFVKAVIGDRSCHLTRVDFAFYLSKTFFSVDFLLATFWAKGYSPNGNPKEFENPIHAKLTQSRYQSFTVGKKNRLFKFYDCDAHNGNKRRDEKKMVNGMINFEVEVREYLKSIKIRKIDDLRNPPFDEVLNVVEFYNPSKTGFGFKSPRKRPLRLIWREYGLQAFMKAIFKRWSNYPKIVRNLIQLRIQDRTFKQAIIDLAKLEHERWMSGRCRPGRFGVQKARYAMKPLFSSRK